MTRAEKAPIVKELREDGWEYRQIADQLGISRSYAFDLYSDPDGDKNKARKASYGKNCLDCGKRTTGADGRAKAPDRCNPCAARHNAYWSQERIIEAIHRWVERFGAPPTASSWNTGHRCHDPVKWATDRWPPVGTVQGYFGSWAEAIEQAGYPRPQPTGPPPNSLTTEELIRTVELYRSGLSLSEVGARLGMTGNGVRLRLVEAGEPRRPPATYGFSPELKKRVLALFSEGFTAREVASLFSISGSVVYRWASKQGIYKRETSEQRVTATHEPRSFNEEGSQAAQADRGL